MTIYGLKIDTSDLTDSMRDYILSELKDTQLIMPFDNTPLYDLFERFCKDRGGEKTPSLVEEWFEHIDDDLDYTPSYLLCEIINKKENISLSCECDVFGCAAYYPWQFDETMAQLTEEKFTEIMDRYMKEIGIAGDLEFKLCDWDTSFMQ